MEADPPTSSTAQLLDSIYSGAVSSQDLPRYLYSFIQHDERDQYSFSLQRSDPELIRLVDFLDKVCAFPSTFRPAMKPNIQALDTISTTDDVFRTCLHKLYVICSHHTIPPSSHNIFSDNLTVVGRYPMFTNGGSADVWEGVYRRKKVCIKRPRVTMQTLQSDTQVRAQYQHTLFVAAEGSSRTP